MHQIYGLEVDNLTIKAVKDTLLIKHQIDLENSQEGRQHNDAFILGKLCSEATVDHNGRKRRQLILQEVKEDGISAKKFEVFVYGNYVTSLESCLVGIRQDTCWILFRKITLELTHRRNRSEWSAFLIRLDDDKCHNCVIVTIFPKHRQLSNNIPYTDIANLKVGGKHNVFAVVARVLKDALPTNNPPTRHSLFAITDPTCDEVKDILLHVFINSATENFPCTVETGDVIRITHMLVESFRCSKTNGKVYSPSAIRIFKKEEGSLSVYSQKSNYIYSKFDQVKVTELMSWRDAHPDLSALQARSKKNPPHVIIKSLSEIKTTCSFDLECQILQTKDVPDRDLVQLRVVDGTTCGIYVTELDYDDPESYMNSQTDKAVLGAAFVDIVVFKPLAEAKKLQPRQFVRLQGIQCSEIADMSMNATDQLLLYDFQMDEDASIKPINDHHCGSVREIIRRIKMKCNDEEEQPGNAGSQSSIIQFVRNVANEEYSKNFGTNDSEKTNTEPNVNSLPNISPSRNRRKSNQELDDEMVASDASPKSPVANVNSGTANLSPVNQSPLRSNATKNTDSSYMLGPTPERGSIRRIIYGKSPYSANREELTFMDSEDSAVDTSVEDAAPCTSLREYLANQKNMQSVKLRLKLLKLSVIGIIPKPKFGAAANLLWGFCPNCGVAYSSVELRESYSTKDLISLDYLFCVQCRPQKRRKTTEYPHGGAVTPYFAAALVLSDPTDESVVVKAKLTGDEAEAYFGVKPSFKFVLDEADDMKTVLATKFRINSILDLNLIRRDCTAQGIYIC